MSDIFHEISDVTVQISSKSYAYFRYQQGQMDGRQMDRQYDKSILPIYLKKLHVYYPFKVYISEEK